MKISPHTPSSHRLRAFTLLEMLVVISIIALLATLTFSGVRAASKAKAKSRVKAELAMIETAIQSYQAAYGSYPPDHALNGTNANNTLHALYYELTGTVLDQTAGTFSVANSSVALNASQIQAAFGVPGFLNATDGANAAKSFGNFGEKQVETITVNNGGITADVEVLAVPVKGPVMLTNTRGDEINPWRYNASNPTRNPGSFDLWAVIKISDGPDAETITIGNWIED